MVGDVAQIQLGFAPRLRFGAQFKRGLFQLQRAGAQLAGQRNAHQQHKRQEREGVQIGVGLVENIDHDIAPEHGGELHQQANAQQQPGPRLATAVKPPRTQQRPEENHVGQDVEGVAGDGWLHLQREQGFPPWKHHRSTGAETGMQSVRCSQVEPEEACRDHQDHAEGEATYGFSGVGADKNDEGRERENR